MGLLYGLDIGGTKIEFSVFDEELERLETSRIATPLSSYSEFLLAVASLVKNADNTFECEAPIGIGLPGQQTSYGITRCNNIPCINGMPLKRDLERVIGRPVSLANDANCFALSEALSPELQKSKTVLALILGTGFGGGLVINQLLYQGHNGAALEVGHTPLPPEAKQFFHGDISAVTCRCGKVDCLDHYLSGSGFSRLFNELFSQSLTGPEIVKRYYAGGEEATSYVDAYLRMVACSLSGLISTFDPEVIVFGGGLSNFDAIYSKLPLLLTQYSLNQKPVPMIRKARYGDSSGIRGAALLNR